MLIPIDRKIVIPEDDERFLIAATLSDSFSDLAVQVNVGIYGLDDTLELLNKHNHGKCVAVYQSGLRIVLIPNN